MIHNHLAKSITKVASKSFTKMYDPKKVTIQKIFITHWDTFLADPIVINNGVRPVVSKEVERMMICGTIDSGFEIFECPNCHKTHLICYSCKSRFCNSCGIKFAKKRAETIANLTLNVSHRHVVFTMDERLRIFFKKDRDLLNVLFDAVKETLYYTFNKMNGKDHTFTPGFILTLHTFGRALNWNPHIHCLLSEGGMDENSIYHHIKYINYETLRKSLMRCLATKMKEFYQEKPKELKQLKQLWNTIYKEKTEGFYVNAPKMKQKKGKDAVVTYMIRYAGRPAMAESRILSYDKKKQQISYYYEDHKTQAKIEVNEDIITFMKKLVQHIPETQFKMVRYYGLYATCDHIHKPAMEKTRERSQKEKRLLSYRKELIETFDTDPLLCECGHYMEFIDYWVPSNGRKENAYENST